MNELKKYFEEKIYTNLYEFFYDPTQDSETHLNAATASAKVKTSHYHNTVRLRSRLLRQPHLITVWQVFCRQKCVSKIYFNQF